jgi:hypothetical protein
MATADDMERWATTEGLGIEPDWPDPEDDPEPPLIGVSCFDFPVPCEPANGREDGEPRVAPSHAETVCDWLRKAGVL